MISDRIKLLRTTLKLNQEAFGKKLGVSNTAISKLETAERNVTDQMMLVICNAFDVNRTWLETGEGDMFVFVSKDEEFDRLCTEIQLSDDNFLKGIMRSYWKLPDEHKKIIQDMLKSALDYETK